MRWVTIIWSMIASACLTLALVHLLVWWRQREARANLLFSLTAAATAAFAGCELWAMMAETAGEYGRAVWWAHAPFWVLAVSLVGFVRLYLQAGRPWLAWTVCGLRTLTMILNLFLSPNVNYREITALRQIPFLGESVSVAEGVPNPWMLVGQLSSLLLIVFVADATVAVCRRGERRHGVALGGVILFFGVIALVQPVLFLWGVVQAPFTISLSYMGIVAAMGFKLSRDVIRAAQLARELQESEAGLRESEERIELAASAAELGLWTWDIARDIVWATDKARTLFGFTKSEPIDFDRFLQTLHPDDRVSAADAMAKSMNGDGQYESEHHVVITNRPVRWIASLGRVEFDGAGKPIFLRAVSLDITARKKAEETKNSLAAIVNSSDDAIFSKTLEGTITSWNAGAEKMYGYSAGEMVGQHVSTLAPAELKHELPEILERIKRGQSVDHLETARVTRDGKRIHVSVTISPIKDGHGTITGASSIARDITERRRDEKALQHLTGRLLTLQDEEQQRVAAELHDGLGQSLAIIKNRALIGLGHQTNPDRASEQLEEISATATAAILEVREIAHNLRPYELDRLGLVAAIESMMGRVSDATPIDLTADLERIEGLLSPAAETSVYRIVQESLNNVVKHSQATAARIEIKKVGNQLAISVGDNGKGMPRPSPMDNGGNGAGFGLAGIAQRVRVLGGSFEIESQPGLGTTLTVRLEAPNAAAG